MKLSGDRKVVGLAVFVAITMHLLLFLIVHPVNGNGLAGARVPPETYYRVGSSEGDTSGSIRSIWSPVLFSLPSKVGFSQDLLNERPRTSLTFRQPNDKERFLDVTGTPHDAKAEVDPAKLLVVSGGLGTLRPPPSAAPISTVSKPAPRRVYIAPELKERLMGGIVLPPELNRRGADDAAWEVRADLRVSEQGILEHVLLEQPLEDESLNRSVLRLLHSLRFKAGDQSVDGRIEIYSPEAASDGSVTP